MPRISELSIRNVRCFGPAQQARLGRITLLVGENSVGKSTFLGCYNTFANLSNLVDAPGGNPFDVPPFSMGDFNTIARSGASDFTVAGQYDDHIHSTARFCFGRADGRQPFEKNVAFTFARADTSPACIGISTDKDKKQLLFHGPNFEFAMNWSEVSFISISQWLSSNARRDFLPYSADRATFKNRRGLTVTSKEVAEFVKFINFFRSEMPLPKERCFNVVAPEPKLPSRQRIYQEAPGYLNDPAERARISRVGTTLGLWQDIKVNDVDLGDGMEVTVALDGGSYNLQDVGYGVHSLLPLVHAIAVAEAPGIFLLQQPEIHVHPVAQARLAQYMAEGPHDFIIETHSDHIVDRFRLCVMQQVLQPEELSILYFEKSEDGTESRIHNISVDCGGNIIDPPDSYREFFLTETELLLGLR